MAKIYPCSVSGEASYQDAIKRTRIGERIALRLEPDNPYDTDAIALENSNGETIGYLPRNNFLASAIHENTSEAEVTIMTIKAAEGGNLGVVLSVSFQTDNPSRVYTGKYQRPVTRSWLSRLLGD